MAFSRFVRHPEYSHYYDLWCTIKELLDPYLLYLNRDKYILPRISEDREVYKHRLKKFTYTPIMSRAISDLVKRLNTSSIKVNHPENKILANVDVMKLINTMVRDWLSYGKSIWLLQEDQLMNIPVLSLINWDDDFSVLKFDKYEVTLDDAPKWYERYFVMTKESFTEYNTKGGGLNKVSESNNPLGEVPLFVYSCPDELWTAKSAYLKQIEHLMVDNSIIDASSNMYVQRVLKPNYSPDDDLDFTYTDRPESSNYHLVNGDFSFAEPSGTSIMSNQKLLSFLEGQIRALISMSNLDRQNAIESAESKKIDAAEIEQVLKDLGLHLRESVLSLFNGVLKLEGRGGKVTVEGLEVFDVNTLSGLLSIAQVIDKLEIDPKHKTAIHEEIGRKLTPH